MRLAIRLVLPLLVLAACGAESEDPAAATARPAESAAPGASAEASGGRLSYLRHCAACHGESGRGDGPLADELTTPPPDLTTLARRNHGRFDEREVMAFIDGERHVEAHGPREMPVWGAVLRRENQAQERPWPSYVTFLEIRSLVDHLRSIQRE